MENKQKLNRLENFPISFFSVIMGLSGLSIAWGKAMEVFGIEYHINTVLVGIASVIFVVLILMYLTKIIKYPSSVAAELAHPVKLSFFLSVSISFLLLSIAYLNINVAVAKPLWMIGVALHLSLTLYIISTWMHHEHFKVNHINPAWFIPAVGNMLVPIAGMVFGYEEISWFFFSIGFMFWVILMTIFFNRVLFHNPMDTHLLPTLFILIAPPAVGFISYMRLNAGLDNLCHFLYFAALFLTLLLLSQGRRFIRLPFFLSWWAYTFSLAAITIASFAFYEKNGNDFFLWLATGLLILVTLVVLITAIKTFIAITKHGICVSEVPHAPAVAK
ncbi:MAG: SLAC1 anion channel family protein [Cocleimonas sp.]|nr:SLAC1 anion channel family protein [Cocleimonas sp.]